MPRNSGLLANYTKDENVRSLRRARLAAERAAKLEAEQAVAIKSRFLALMSHQLRTPLNTIIGFSEILTKADRLEEDRIRQFSGFIRDSGTTLLGILNDIIEVSRLSSGLVTISRSEVDLRELVDLVFHGRAEEARSRGIDLRTAIAIDARLIVVDQERFRRVLACLVDNAIRYNNQNGRVTIGAERVGPTDIAVTIADTGIGMNQVELARALTPFGVADDAYDARSAGAGLGLTIAKGLIDAHDADFAIDSATGSGTRVTITLHDQAAEVRARHHGVAA